MSPIPTERQTSAGGVAIREHESRVEVALILVGKEGRWQLPKGLIERDEPPESTALREVREEAGIEGELLGLIDTVAYWYYSTRGGQQVRIHKFVHFYLLRALSGDVSQHDQEVEEARWVEIGEAEGMLAFAGEKQIVAKARTMIAANIL